MTSPLRPFAEDRARVVTRLLRPGRGRDAPRMLALHGLASSAAAWDDLAAQVDGDWALWAAELPWGTGSGSLGWAQDPNVGSWVARALDAVPGGADVVVAHSFAASALLSYLDQAVPERAGPERAGPGQAGPEQAVPERAVPSGIVLVSPFYRASAEQFDWETISYYFNGFARILADGIRVRAGGRLDPRMREDIALRVQDLVGPYGWIRFFDTYLRTPGLRVDRIGAPCLVVAGERDFAAPPADARALAAALPDARLHIIPDCGHFPATERAESFGALVNEFLMKITDMGAICDEHRTANRDEGAA
ncbi:MAG: alpha/beta hydrolase [Nocardiopsaceae bacterium]|nr:alpha/beta hydrolase [Nocardiopsaceae bacterium]